MPMFVCSRCSTVENTALAPSYWTEEHPLCSRCATGRWHGRFPAEEYDAERDGPVTQSWLLPERKP